jgi:hypothetical protein
MTSSFDSFDQIVDIDRFESTSQNLSVEFRLFSRDLRFPKRWTLKCQFFLKQTVAKLRVALGVIVLLRRLIQSARKSEKKEGK